ncbi:pimeloyl-ACP methyl ester carboxylesterase [Tumebacillus sp. BK434]|uniref:alpha/beta fold hydrolase n=1 Tax=Tumebacillus sp. BK434 TaxID=2512169 RepID=UPI00104EE8AB|nr:alpha/beta hydrolase [Tumebacillus sp. BK434]TCP59371.1 pimeloyl-ACP methyl ester carboxylesterase [Tumebacillus sp. BK434]
MDLHYEVLGAGQPVVLLHGGGTDSRDWTPLAPLLSEKYKVVLPDARGCGQSPAPVEPPHYVNDLLALLDHLEFEKATLIGHSVGGQIATEFAFSHPNRVQDLILVSPALSGFAHATEFVELSQRVWAAATDPAKMTELTLEACFYSNVMKSPHRGLMAEMTAHNIKKMFQWQTRDSQWPTPRAIERLHELPVRTLFFRGTLDTLDSSRIAEHFRAAPDIRFVEIEGGDHKINLTHSEELFANIMSFLET